MVDPIVYVIDDDDGAREALEFLLDTAAIKVRSFSCADSFLSAAPSLAGACVVTDVRMPGTNGIQLVDELRRRGLQLPVIVITGHADVPLAIQALHAGVSDFIEKPFDDQVMLDAIHKAIAQQAGHQQAQAEQQEVLSRIESLSGREKEVMEGLVRGEANKAIAFDLSISARTVEVYRANVMMKMRARSLSDLVRMVTTVRQR